MKHFLSFLFFASCFPFFGQTYFSFKGIVKDSSTIEGVELKLVELNKKTYSNSQGFFQFDSLVAGNYQLVCFQKNYEQDTFNILIPQTKIQEVFKLRVSKTLNLNTVFVSKNRRRKTSFQKMQKSTSIVNTVKKSEIDHLPTKNAADLAQRLPSVSLFRSKGESNMVSMRGTPVDWTSVLVNGDRLPVACEDNPTRSFEFEAFPAVFVDEVIEAKGITPDLESDNIGGALNFLFPEFADSSSTQLEFAIGQNFYSNLPYGNMNFSHSNTSKNKKFSYLISGTYFGRTYATQARKTIFGNNFNHGINRLELRNYHGFRGTAGVHAAIAYKPTSKLTFTLRSFGGQMLDDKNMDKISFNWYEDNLRRVRLQNAKGKLVRQIYGATFEVDYKINQKIATNFRLSSYKNEFKPRNFPYKGNDARNGFVFLDFMSPEVNFTDYEQTDFYGQAIDPNSTDFSLIKLIGSDNPYGNGGDPAAISPNFTDQLSPSDFEFTQAYSEINRISDTDPIVLQNDWEVKFNDKWLFNAGLKYRFKSGSRLISKHDWFRDFSGGNSDPILLSDFSLRPFMNNGSFFQNLNGDLYSNFNYQILDKESVASFFTENGQSLREVPMNTSNFEYNQWVGASYTYKEHQSSGFAMLTYSGKKFDFLTGLRVEHTYLIETSDTLTNELALDTLTNTYYNVPKSITIFRPYVGFLPSFHINWYASKKMNFKFGVSRTMHRPNFEETKPGQAVIKYNELDFTFGNPNLKPVFSINLDVDGEFYFSESSVLTVGAYFKQISNHIYTLSKPNVDPISGATMRYFANASASWVGGLELFYAQKFGWIHSSLKDVGIRMNASFSDSRMQIEGRPENQKMTKQVPFLGAIELFYENDKFELHTNLSYTSRYLNELNLVYLNGELLHKDDDFDVYTNDFMNLEASILVQLSNRIKMKAELGNILNYSESKSRGKDWRMLNQEYFGLRGEVGVVISL